MTPQDFCYWLQGFAELNADAPTPEQWKVIRDHLQLTFNKITPTYPWQPTILPFTPDQGSHVSVTDHWRIYGIPSTAPVRDIGKATC